MHDFIAWLNANSGAISVLASIVAALATVVLMATTIVYAWHTWQLAKENRLLRKAGTDPQVVAYASLNPRAWGAIEFVISNLGKGAARNVTFKIVSGGEDFDRKKVRLPHAGVRFSFLPQGDQISTMLGMGFDLLAEPSLAPFKVEVQYEDMKELKYCDSFDINVSAFEGLVRLGNPAEDEIADALKKIEATMARWTSGGLIVETITTQERERRDEERRQQIMAQREEKGKIQQAVPLVEEKKGQ